MPSEVPTMSQQPSTELSAKSAGFLLSNASSSRPKLTTSPAFYMVTFVGIVMSCFVVHGI
jgi:hypothetical protein